MGNQANTAGTPRRFFCCLSPRCNRHYMMTKPLYMTTRHAVRNFVHAAYNFGITGQPFSRLPCPFLRGCLRHVFASSMMGAATRMNELLCGLFGSRKNFRAQVGQMPWLTVDSG